jgi:signal peptidase II
VPASTGRGRLLLLLSAVAAVTVVLDQTTKAVALAHLESGPIPLLGGIIRLTLARNIGSAFGLPAPAWVTTAVSLIVCVVVLVWVARGGGASLVRAIALGLVLGGAVGNLADRVRAGAVVDFIDLGIWPVFNVADIGLTIGIGLLMLEAIRRR